MAQRDRSIIFPGWYWYNWTDELDQVVSDFIRANAGVMRVRTTFRGDTARARVIVFEVVGSNLHWTIPGLPTKAPKKGKTTIGDLSSSAPPDPSLGELIEEFGEKVKTTAKGANTALNVLIWGAVAVVLFNLYSATKSEGGDDGE